MKVLFLDIDGVLNSWDWWQKRKELFPREDDGDERPKVDRLIMGVYTTHEIDPAAVKRLNALVKQTGSTIVVSSTWRKGRTIYDLISILSSFGVAAPIFDKTPDLGTRRGIEIDTWLKKHKALIEKFAIVDDDADMEPHMDKLVKTEFAHGLLDEHCERLAKLLE